MQIEHRENIISRYCIILYYIKIQDPSEKEASRKQKEELSRKRKV